MQRERRGGRERDQEGALLPGSPEVQECGLGGRNTQNGGSQVTAGSPCKGPRSSSCSPGEGEGRVLSQPMTSLPLAQALQHHSATELTQNNEDAPQAPASLLPAWSIPPCCRWWETFTCAGKQTPHRARHRAAQRSLPQPPRQKRRVRGKPGSPELGSGWSRRGETHPGSPSLLSALCRDFPASCFKSLSSLALIVHCLDRGWY